MKKIINFPILLFVVLLLLITGLKGYSQKADPKETTQKFTAMLQILDYFYVDSIDSPELVETAIVSMLKELDPHSTYISKEDVEKANEPLIGNFEGVGIQFQIFEDTILVIAPIPGGPSEKLGIMAGDKIVQIDDDVSVGSDIDNQFVFDHLRGKKGTTVDVKIYRKGREDLLEFSIVRDKIPINSVDAVFMATPEIGYIKINRFSRTTIKEFTEGIAKLKEQGMKELIVDLRYNTGGYLNTAIELSDQFLKDGKLVVYTEGLKSPKTNFKATYKGEFEEGQLVILINEGSASASEIVSGAVQDWDRGIIIGRRSFGKGLVQKPFRLPDESVVRLTTAKYYTPSGRCIQKSYANGIEDYYKDFSKRVEHGELVHSDSIKFPDSLKYYTESNRVVYGGGGIMPDVFIPFDSTRYSDYYIDLRRKGVFNNFILTYMDQNRVDLEAKYPEFKRYQRNFSVSEELMSEFIEYAVNEEVEFDEEGYKTSEIEIKTIVEALIARNLYDYNSYFEIINEIDEGFINAVEVLEEDVLFEKLSITD